MYHAAKPYLWNWYDVKRQSRTCGTVLETEMEKDIDDQKNSKNNAESGYNNRKY